MESALCLYLFIFVAIGLCPLLSGAPALNRCSESDLNITGGTYTLSKDYSEDSILRYHCQRGYYPHPIKMRQCDRGTWDPQPTKKRPVCKKITCPNPNVLDNGVVEPYQMQYQVNDTTTYRCHSDYTLRGSSKRTCQFNGKWTGSTPICSRDSDHCPDPGTPPGTSRTGHIFNIDDKVTYRCDAKLKLLGSKVRVCQDDGQWSGREPECYADYTYDTPEEVAGAFAGTLQTTLNVLEEKGQQGKLVRMDQKGKLNIYIALDASDSINIMDFEKAKEVIINLLEKISYYEVFPKYEIIIFASGFTRIVSIADQNNEDKKILFEIMQNLTAYHYDGKGQKSGTNIAKAYEAILDSMSFERTNNKARFNEIQHVIIMFTDGIANMGGNPIHKISEIKQIVYDGDEENRDRYLDLYVFAVGDDVQKDDISDWVTVRKDETHAFFLKDMNNLENTFNAMLDETTSTGLCGLYRNEDDDDSRSGFPWVIEFTVNHEDGIPSKCLGSLVTPSFILTAAHCFKLGDLPESISILKPPAMGVKNFTVHSKYAPRGKVSEGISENYVYDVALIELEKGVEPSKSLRPICIPCTNETSRALRLSSNEGTCVSHRHKLLNSNLVKAFFMSFKGTQNPKKNVQIKLKDERDECIEDTKIALNISEETARQLITDNFLCTGEGESDDQVSCKGDSGGATFVQQKYRAFQVGVVSWGLKDVCRDDKDDEHVKARDFHVDLFNEDVQDFLKLHLGDKKRGAPLHFLE